MSQHVMVFISYSWDSQEHTDKVISFTDHLRKNGFEANLDRILSQEETSPNFIKIMHKAMAEHQKVIVVLSKGYKAKAEKFTGGVGEEYSLLLNDITTNHQKYILVSFEGRSDEITPLGLKGRDIVDLSKSVEEDRLFRKLLDEREFELSPVSENKPKLKPYAIKDYPSEQGVAESQIDVIGIDYKELTSSSTGGFYREITFNLSVDFKNTSTKVVEGFGFEIRLIKYLDPLYYSKSVEGDMVIYSETITEKIYPNQTKRSKALSLKLTAANVLKVAGSNVRVDTFTDSGSRQKTFLITDIIKIRPGGAAYQNPVALSPKLFIQ